MKSFLRLVLASALLAPAALLAATFEGKVTMQMISGRNKPQEITYKIKGDKVRLEIAGQKEMGGMIMDTTKKEMVMIMDEQKMYMTMALPDSAKQAIDKQAQDLQLEKTNDTEKILGYTATKWIMKEKNGTETEMWLAEGLGSFMGFSGNQNPMGRGRSAPAPAWERALAGKDAFPLRVVGYEKGALASKGKSADHKSDKAKGKGAQLGAGESFRMEVTAIDKSSQPDSLFTPPAGYQKFDMGGMMKGLIPGAR
jgi:hypothetical protein